MKKVNLNFLMVALSVWTLQSSALTKQQLIDAVKEHAGTPGLSIKTRADNFIRDTGVSVSKSTVMNLLIEWQKNHNSESSLFQEVLAASSEIAVATSGLSQSLGRTDAHSALAVEAPSLEVRPLPTPFLPGTTKGRERGAFDFIVDTLYKDASSQSSPERDATSGLFDISGSVKNAEFYTHPEYFISLKDRARTRLSQLPASRWSEIFGALELLQKSILVTNPKYKDHPHTKGMKIMIQTLQEADRDFSLFPLSFSDLLRSSGFESGRAAYDFLNMNIRYNSYGYDASSLQELISSVQSHPCGERTRIFIKVWSAIDILHEDPDFISKHCLAPLRATLESSGLRKEVLTEILLAEDTASMHLRRTARPSQDDAE